MMDTSFRVVARAADVPESDRRCTCCGRLLKTWAVFLELDQRTQTYHDHGGVPPEKSQGWFPFGQSCARAMLGRHFTAEQNAKVGS